MSGRRPLLKAAAALYVLALALRLTLAFGFHRYEIGRPEPVRIAISLATHRGFADPYAIPTGPTAHTPPLYPALIAPLYVIWGDAPQADFARIALNAFAAAAEYALLPVVSTSLGLGLWPGLLAGVGGALIPLHYWPECMGDFETTWLALFLELSTIWFARFLRAPSFAAGRAVRAGVWWGLGFLLAPNVLLVLAAFAAIALWRVRERAAALRGLALLGVTALAVVSPWVIRNYVRLGSLSFIRDNFGLELYVSNHDGASPYADYNVKQPYYRDAHPHFSEQPARELQRLGEAGFQRTRLAAALAWIREHPGRFAALTAAREAAFWFPSVPRLAPAFWAVAVLGLAGLAALFFEARPAAIVLAAVLAGHAAVYTVVQTSLRYQHPVYWVLVLLTGYLVSLPLRRFLPEEAAQDALHLRNELHEYPGQH